MFYECSICSDESFSACVCGFYLCKQHRMDHMDSSEMHFIYPLPKKAKKITSEQLEKIQTLIEIREPESVCSKIQKYFDISLYSHNGGVTQLKMDKNQQFLFSAGKGSHIKVWDLNCKKILFTLSCSHTSQNQVNDFLLMNDEKFIVTGETDSTMKIWNIYEKKLEGVIFEENYEFERLLKTSDEKFLISKSQKSIIVWNFETRSIETKFPEEEEEIIDINMTSNDIFLVACFSNHLIKIWHFPSQSVVFEIVTSIEDMQKIAISSENEYFAVAGPGMIKVWRFDDFEEHATIESSDRFSCIEFTPDNKLLICGHSDVGMSAWSLETCTKVREMITIAGGVESLIVSKNSDFFIFGCGSGLICQRSIIDFSQFEIFPGHLALIHLFAFTKDFKFLITSAYDNSIRMWDIENKKQIKMINGIKKTASLQLINNEKQIIFNDQNLIKIMNLEDFSIVETLNGHKKEIENIFFNDEKTMILTQCRKKFLTWDLEKKVILGMTKNEFFDAFRIFFIDDNKHLLVFDLENIYVLKVDLQKKYLIDKVNPDFSLIPITLFGHYGGAPGYNFQSGIIKSKKYIVINIQNSEFIKTYRLPYTKSN